MRRADSSPCHGRMALAKSGAIGRPTAFGATAPPAHAPANERKPPKAALGARAADRPF